MVKIKKSSGSMNAIKRFIGNKNIVTILGIFGCIAILFVGYFYRVSAATSPIPVPYAKENIDSRTLITRDMIGTINVSSTYVSEAGDIVKTVDEVLNKYVSYKTNIPKGSLFYKNQLKEADEMPDSAFANIEDGETIYSLAVTIDETYANSIYAGQYIDLYMSATDTKNNLVIYGRLIESIRVLAVKDSYGNNILTTTMTAGLKPSELLFAVKDDMYLLLMQSQYIQSKVKLVPVLRNRNYTESANATLVSSDQLREFITEQVEVLVG